MREVNKHVHLSNTRRGGAGGGEGGGGGGVARLYR